ncbi:MAG: hypothetical protein ACFFD3_08155 [Candidatus Thorarchaeota archaeon]
MTKENDRSNENLPYVIIILLVAIILAQFSPGLSFAFLLFLFIMFICAQSICNQTGKRREILEQAVMIAESYDQEESVLDELVDDDLDEYTFPAQCPQCGEKIRLDLVKWVSKNTAICPNCESLITAGQR